MEYCTFLVLSWLGWSSAQLCNSRAPVSRFTAIPTPYKGVVVVQQSGQCVEFSCPYGVVLGDDEHVPRQPNLDSEDDNNDIGKFLVWQSKTRYPYVNFDLGSAREITALNIEFLNYPAQEFSLPNLQLFTADDSTSALSSPPGTPVSYVMLDNDVLSQNDYKVTRVTLLLTDQAISSRYFFLHWNYSGIYHLDYFMVSEVEFCLDTQPPYSATEIEFLNPLVDNTSITFTVEDITTTSALVLNCTVSIPGSFEWQWRQNGSPDVKFKIFTADGTRTSIARLEFYDPTSYTCEVKHRSSTSYVSRTLLLSFPVLMDTVSQVTGYLDVGVVVLNCEVHGFLRSTNPPTWLDKHGTSVYANRSKYIVIQGSREVGLQPAVLISSRAATPSLRSTLIIRHLEEGDAGNYTCMVDGNSSKVHLLIEELTGLYMSTESSCTQTAALASFISSLITALIAVGITIGVQFAIFFYIKHRSKTTLTRHQRNEDFDVHIYEVMDRTTEPSTTSKDTKDSTGSYAVNAKENEAYGAVDY